MVLVDKFLSKGISYLSSYLVGNPIKNVGIASL